MQKVAWPITIVSSDRLSPMYWNAEFSAMPVMIPGSARGSTSSSDTVSRPKKRKRCTPAAASEPSSNATAVASRPAFSDSSSAERTCWSCQATESHFVDSPDGGQLWTFDLLNAYRMINAIGTNRKSSTSTTHTRSSTLVRRPSIIVVTPSERLEGSERACAAQVADHDHDRHQRQRGGERQVVGSPDVRIDHVADQLRVGAAD